MYDIPLGIFKPRRAGSVYLQDKQHKTHIVKKKRPRFAELSLRLKFGDNKANIEQDKAI